MHGARGHRPAPAAGVPIGPKCAPVLSVAFFYNKLVIIFGTFSKNTMRLNMEKNSKYIQLFVLAQSY